MATSIPTRSAIGDGTGFGRCDVGILRGQNQKNVDLARRYQF